MIFNNSEYLFLLPLLIVLYLIGLSGIKDFIKRKNKFINVNAFNKLQLKNNLGLKYASIFLWIVVIFSCLIALARPQGKIIGSESEQSVRDIVIALDISDSMRAMDATISGSYSEYSQISELRNISRFEAAKKIIKGFTKTLSGDRLSLVTFSDTAFPLTGLSTDYQAFNSAIDNLDFTYSSGGGTDLGEAISVSEKRFYDKTNKDAKIIIIVSDGEEQDKHALEIAKKLKDNVVIETIGVGSKDGSKIYMGKNIYGEPLYKSYLGQDVITRLNDKILKDIADNTNGKYFEVTDENISNDLFQEINRIKPANIKTNNSVQREEFFQIFILIALFLIMFEIFIPVIKKFTKEK